MRSREGRKQFLQEVFLTKSPISLQKLDNLTRAWSLLISRLAMEVNRLARAVLDPWAIENSCHWVLDVTYREDEWRIREEALRENLAWLNRFTLSLLKQHPDRASIAMKRRSCG
jgi:predicted transposase YbfD/YdcC